MIELTKQQEDALADAILAAERKTGRRFDLETVFEVMKYSIRKLEVIKKGIDYLPLLLETELCDHVMREEINWRGELNRVCNLYEESLRQPVSQRA